MRADLLSSEGNVTLLSDEELIEFYSEAGARAFLNQFIFDPSNMETMRRALGEELGFAQVVLMSDQQVIDELATRLARTCVAWTKVDLLPTISADYTAAEPDDSEQEANEALSEEQESEPEDVKPEPVIPPEYPALAKREGDAIKDQTDVYNLKLDLLRYVGMDAVPDANVPKTAKAAAYSMANRLLDSAKAFTNPMLALARQEDILITETEVGAEQRRVAASIRHPLVLVALAMAEKLRSIMGMQRDEPMSSEVAAIYQLLSGSQGDKLKEGAEGFGTLLDKLFGPPEEEPHKETPAIRFVLEDVYGTPMPDERYSVEFPDGHTVSGQTDQDGAAVLKDVGEGPFKLTFPSIRSPWKIVAGENPEMNVYKVVSGDTLGKIAKKFSIESWVSLYEHEANASFRALRPNPNKIWPGDQIYIPDQPPSVWEVKAGETTRCRLIDPLHPELADDTRIWIKYIFQKGNDIKLIGAAHEDVDWERDIFDHPRNAALRKQRPKPSSFKPGDELYIPVPDKPYIRYVIQDGDWLSKIGAAHEKEWQKDIYLHQINAEFKTTHENPDVIFPGEILYIPRDDVPEIEFVSYEIKPCDYLERIGEAFGVDWLADIYNHWRNADFKAKRPDPNLVYPGDVIYIQKDLIKKDPARKPVEKQFKTYEIKKGDWLSKIAAAEGITDWKGGLYDLPANAVFRKKRPNPDRIQPGDVVCIPLANIDGWVEFLVVNQDEKPMPDIALDLQLANGELRTVISDADGKIALSEIDAGDFGIRRVYDAKKNFILPVDDLAELTE